MGRVHTYQALSNRPCYTSNSASANGGNSDGLFSRDNYLALVHGVPPESEGTFSSYLVENGVLRVHSTTDPKRGKLSHTAYKVLGHSQGVSLLDINLLTGRKHQIRVHLAEHNLPIVGDMKYGGKRSGERRLALHAKSLAFEHPHSGKPCFFETRIPHLFSRISV